MSLLKKWKNFKENIKKAERQIESTNEQVEQIKKDLDKYLGGALKKSIKYDETLEMLSNVQILVDKVDLVFNQESLAHGIKVHYKVLPIEIRFDTTNKEFVEDARFKAMNLLDLISVEDMQKISNALRKAKEKNE